LAILRLLGFESHVSRLLLALPTSLSLAALVSAILVYSGLPAWSLGLSALLAMTVGAIALDLARGPITSEDRPRTARTKLEDEARQVALIDTFMEGGTLADAAEAAGVSLTTLHRALQSSERLRRAVSVASHGRLRGR
jgi:hypothetical protein